MLAIQIGPTSDKLMRIPLDEKDVTKTTKFVQGKCFYMMGKFSSACLKVN